MEQVGVVGRVLTGVLPSKVHVTGTRPIPFPVGDLTPVQTGVDPSSAYFTSVPGPGHLSLEDRRDARLRRRKERGRTYTKDS